MSSPAARSLIGGEPLHGRLAAAPWRLAVAVLLSAAVAISEPTALRPVSALLAGSDAAEPSVEVALADTDVSVLELVEVVRRAAAAVPGAEPDHDVRIVFTDEIDGPDGQYLGGRQVGTTVFVRVSGTAVPTRSLVHELAHALTPGDGHGERFRAVYLASIGEIFDESFAAREGRRLAWVYDRCYLDDSCPTLRPAGTDA